MGKIVEIQNVIIGRIAAFSRLVTRSAQVSTVPTNLDDDIVVGLVGLEPTRPHGHLLLRQACLPFHHRPIRVSKGAGARSADVSCWRTAVKVSVSTGDDYITVDYHQENRAWSGPNETRM